MNLVIRSARQTDVEVICEFNRLIARETEDKELDIAVLRQGVRAVLGDANKGCYFVAELAGEVVGQLGLTYEWSDWRNGNFWWIQSVYVRASARRKGVFRALYNHVLNTAKAEPTVIGLRLYVEHDNHVAQKTYAQLGMVMPDYHIMQKYPLVGKE